MIGALYYKRDGLLKEYMENKEKYDTIVENNNKIKIRIKKYDKTYQDKQVISTKIIEGMTSMATCATICASNKIASTLMTQALTKQAMWNSIVNGFVKTFARTTLKVPLFTSKSIQAASLAFKISRAATIIGCITFGISQAYGLYSNKKAYQQLQETFQQLNKQIQIHIDVFAELYNKMKPNQKTDINLETIIALQNIVINNPQLFKIIDK